jgi:ribosomal protein S18 acetylase RimI-like enzyme
MADTPIIAVDAAAVHTRTNDLVELLADAVEGGASVGYVWPVDRALLTTFWQGVGADVAAGRAELLVAEDATGIAGCVMLVPSMKPNGRHRAEVVKLLVHRRARRQGLGERLMHAVETRARARGLSLMVLDTTADSPAERLYRRLGWQVSGTIPGYALDPDGTPHATRIFHKELVPAARDAVSHPS